MKENGNNGSLYSTFENMGKERQTRLKWEIVLYDSMTNEEVCSKNYELSSLLQNQEENSN